LREVTVVDAQSPSVRLSFADRTDATLALQHAVVVGDGQPILFKETLLGAGQLILFAIDRIARELLPPALGPLHAVFRGIEAAALDSFAAIFRILGITLALGGQPSFAKLVNLLISFAVGGETILPVLQIFRVALALLLVLLQPFLLFLINHDASLKM
jgi:hypothetical protein